MALKTKLVELLGAAIYAAGLLVWWLLGVILLLVVVWILLWTFGRVKNRRKAVITLVPFIVTFVQAMNKIRPGYILLFVIVTGQLDGLRKPISLATAGPMVTTSENTCSASLS